MAGFTTVAMACGGGEKRPSATNAAATSTTSVTSTVDTTATSSASSGGAASTSGGASTEGGTQASTEGGTTTTATSGGLGGGSSTPTVPAGCSTIEPNDCDVVELATGQADIGAFNLTATHLYWRAGEDVMRVPIDGGDAEVLYQGLPGLIGVAVDERRVYVTANSDGGAPLVASFPIAGGELTLLDTERSQPWDIEVGDGFIYYSVASQEADAGLYKMPVDGGTPEHIYTGLASILELWGPYVYFRAYENANTLERVPRDGGDAEVLVSDTLAANFDVGDAGVYLLNGSSLGVVPPEGGTVDDLTWLSRDPAELGGPAVDSRHAYFMDNDGTGGDLVRAGLDGRERTILFSDNQSMKSIALNDTSLFFAEYGSDARVLRMDKCGCQ